MKKNITKFNTIVFDINNNKFESYDVIPYFEECYKCLEKKDRPKTFDEFKEFVKNKSMYQYWSRCEFEIILSDWPPSGIKEKIDVHKQIIMNHDTVTQILINALNVRIND